MRRREFIQVSFGAIVLWPLAARAQQPGTAFRIGILGTSSSTAPEVAHLWQALIEGLRELGYVESRNIVIERRFSGTEPERLPELAAELVSLKVGVIVAGGQPTPIAAKRATATIPIVMTNFSDPVGLGLVTSLARPGGNVTGLSLLTVDLVGKQLELLKQAVPKASRVAFLANPGNPGATLQLQGAEKAARSLGVQLQILEAGRTDELARAFAKVAADAILLPGDSFFFFHRTLIADLAIKSRLPALFAPREFAEAGGLIAYGANVATMYRRAARYIDKIIKGAKPADLPVEQPTKYDLVINLKTAKALGIHIPESILIRADELIE